MVAGNAQRLSKLARELNVGIQTIVEFLHKKGFDIDTNPNTKVPEDICHLLEKEFKSDINLKRESEQITLRQQRIKKEIVTLDDISKKEDHEDDFEDDFIELGDLKKTAAAASKPVQKEKPAEPVKEEPREPLVKPLKIIDKIDINDLPGAKKKQPEKPPVPHPKTKTEKHAEVPESAEKPSEEPTKK